jgi:hypothetical protein
MNLRELEAQAEFLAPVIAAAVAKAVAPLNLELADLRKCLADRPMPVEPEPVDVDAIAQAAAALVVLPEVKDGKDAEPVDLEALAKAAAALVVLPEVKDGKDAEPVDLEVLAKAAAALIVVPEAERVDLEAVAALVKLPEVKDGKDAAEVDLEAVAALVKLPEPEKVDVDAIARAAAALIPVPVIPEPEHGRDAIDLEILPAIEEAKQYPRGTYAAHRGGLWKSYERTHGMRGWECIVDGVDGVSITQDGDREFSVKLMKSSGQEVAQKFALPIQIYKGVFREEQAYDAHDNVTWAGSQWTSTKADNTDKPGSSDAWILVVKAGRNGKDLRENASTFDPAKGVKL